VTEEHLSEDFFAVSYMGFMLEHEKTFHVSRDIQGKNFYACLWIFFVQLALIFLIVKSVVLSVDDYRIYTPNLPVFTSRFLAAFLLHMELKEDVN
jgi:hypothetical protein